MGTLARGVGWGQGSPEDDRDETLKKGSLLDLILYQLDDGVVQASCHSPTTQGKEETRRGLVSAS
jgi:hypothetical protein